jgi:hypothetical protein
MLLEPKDVQLVVALIGADSLEHATNGGPSELGNVDGAFIPGANFPIPPNKRWIPGFLGHEGLLVVRRNNAPGTAQSGRKYLTACSLNSRLAGFLR